MDAAHCSGDAPCHEDPSARLAAQIVDLCSAPVLNAAPFQLASHAPCPMAICCCSPLGPRLRMEGASNATGAVPAAALVLDRKAKHSRYVVLKIDAIPQRNPSPLNIRRRDARAERTGRRYGGVLISSLAATLRRISVDLIPLVQECLKHHEGASSAPRAARLKLSGRRYMAKGPERRHSNLIDRSRTGAA